MIRQRGTTLIELTITMAILGIIAGVTVLALRRFDPPAPADARQILADSLRSVLETGRAVRVRLVVGGKSASAVVEPDGSVIADSIIGVERFTGVPSNAR